MGKILKKKINIRRKETINRNLLVQIIFSIFLVVAVLITKQISNSYTNKYMDMAKIKLNETINYEETFKNMKFLITKLGNKMADGMFFNNDYSAPVSGKIVKEYSTNENNQEENYNGIDIVSNVESVKAVTDGEIIIVGSNSEMKHYLVIESGDKKIIYGQLEEIFVAKGDKVEIGEIIGKLYEDNKLLHIEVWQNGKSINPSKLFKIYE